MLHARLLAGSHQLRVLACDSALERMRGLLGRPEPEPGVALLLQPCWAVHTFGMRYPIDVVFCDARWRVLRVVPALAPRRWACRRGAVRVLELSAHTARPLGLKPGARLEPDTRLRAPRPPSDAREPDPRPLVSPPVRALAGLAVITLCAALLLGGCTAGPAAVAKPPDELPGQSPHEPLDELKLQTDIDYASRAWPLAEAGLRRLLTLEPQESTHWHRLGIVFLRTGRAPEAVESFAAASRLGARDRRTLQNLGLAHLSAAADSLRDAADVASAGNASADREARRRLLAAASAIDALLPAELRAPHDGTPP